MPFKPRIIRFDDEHGGVSSPLGGSVSAPPVESPLQEPAHDPTHDTVCGLEFDTIRDWDPDDALLADPKLQCLARQLSDDAAALAKRYPADGWEPPVVEAVPATTLPAAVLLPANVVEPRRSRLWNAIAGRMTWRPLVGAGIAAAACLIVALGPQALGPQAFGPRTTDVAGSGDVASSPNAFTVGDRTMADRTMARSQFVGESVRRVRYEDGDTASWGPELLDDSQFGEPQFGEDHPDGILSAPGHDALRELLPADSHEYCEASM